MKIVRAWDDKLTDNQHNTKLHRICKPKLKNYRYSGIIIKISYFHMALMSLDDAWMDYVEVKQVKNKCTPNSKSKD